MEKNHGHGLIFNQTGNINRMVHPKILMDGMKLQEKL